MRMISNTADGLRTLHFHNLSDYRGIQHFVSTRLGGFSAPPFESLNLGFKTLDDPANVLRNRRKLADAIGIPLEDFTVTKQVHEARVEVITNRTKGRGALDYESGMDATDAMVTNEPGICLMVLLADCVPVLLHDPVKGAVAAIHSGWKGTVKRISAETLRVMSSEFGTSPADVIAGIGPSIGGCCYQVGPEVISAVGEALGTTDGLVNRMSSDGKGYLDLWETNRRILTSAGVREENIEVAEMCTQCHSDLFFSHRQQPGTGRFGVGIMLRDEMCAECTAMHCAECRK